MWRQSACALLRQTPCSLRSRIRGGICNAVNLPPTTACANNISLPILLLPTDLQCRSFAKRYTNRKTSKKQKQQQQQKKLPPPHIQPRRESDPILQTKHSVPNQEKEKFLGQLQNQVHDAYRAGDYRKGQKAAQALLEACQEHYPKDGHPAIASAYNDLGLFAKLLGDFDQSRLSYQKALKIYKKILGHDHASVSSILHNLGNLNRSQIHLDTTLKATDRLTLLEEALSVTREAYAIRLDERGPEHPHTVASKSSLGATLSMGILQHFKATSNKNTVSQSFLATTDISEDEWGAAEEHLREALQTAIDNPRGLGLQSPEYLQVLRKEKRESIAPQLSNKIQTLSSASAAQNLAIFLKARATTVVIKPESEAFKRSSTKETTIQNSHDKGAVTDDDNDEKKDQHDSEKKDQHDGDMENLENIKHRDAWFQEAHTLYKDVLALRRELLAGKHPDLYATQHSLAELLQAMGDEEAANALRKDIVDTYDPPPSENSEQKDTDSVHVERTTTDKVERETIDESDDGAPAEKNKSQ